MTGEIPGHTEAVNSPWSIAIPLYLGAGLVYALVNLRSTIAVRAVRNLDDQRLGWTVFPMVILSALLWPVWFLSGYAVRWWILRKLDREDRP